MTRIRTRTCAGPVQPDGSIPYKVWLGDGTILMQGVSHSCGGKSRSHDALRRAVENPLPHVE